MVDGFEFFATNKGCEFHEIGAIGLDGVRRCVALGESTEEARERHARWSLGGIGGRLDGGAHLSFFPEARAWARG